jgi:hypothetical protein
MAGGLARARNGNAAFNRMNTGVLHDHDVGLRRVNWRDEEVDYDGYVTSRRP